MVSPETTKTLQFGLRSIFLATTAVGVALGLLKWFGPRESLAVMFFTAPIAAAIAVLVKSKGTAWPGMFVGEALSMIMAIPLFDIHGFGGRILFAFACMVGFRNRLPARVPVADGSSILIVTHRTSSSFTVGQPPRPAKTA